MQVQEKESYVRWKCSLDLDMSFSQTCKLNLLPSTTLPYKWLDLGLFVRLQVKLMLSFVSSGYEAASLGCLG